MLYVSKNEEQIIIYFRNILKRESLRSVLRTDFLKIYLLSFCGCGKYFIFFEFGGLGAEE
jgi:hypothetical protein